MSLHHHVSNKEALLDALAEWAFIQIDLPEFGDPWRDAMVSVTCAGDRTVASPLPFTPGEGAETAFASRVVPFSGAGGGIARQ